MKRSRTYAICLSGVVSCYTTVVIPPSVVAFVNIRYCCSKRNIKSLLIPADEFHPQQQRINKPSSVSDVYKIRAVMDDDDKNNDHDGNKIVFNSDPDLLDTTTTGIKIPPLSPTTTATDTNNKNVKDDTSSNEFDWDTFLDTPFFDPQTILNDPDSHPILKQLAIYVQNDYETVEIIVTGIVFVLLIVMTQELLRIQIYGFDNYIPFSKGINPGNLF